MLSLRLYRLERGELLPGCLAEGGREGGGEEEEKRRGGLVVGGWLEENKCEMKAFLEATKELYTGKGLGSPQWG